MRLLNVDSLDFSEFPNDDLPSYVIASHRWLSEGEATFQQVRDHANGQGYQKVEAFAEYVRKHLSPIKWLWIDTCCINKENAAELSESINLMFEWYRGAEICLAYIADVKTGDDISRFERSEWFKRGWTLQELLAPRTVVFVTKEWHVIGRKGRPACTQSKHLTGIGLEETIAQITGIQEQVLHNYEASIDMCVSDKLKWMKGRTTTRPEDMSYGLYGILGVTLGANYGERYEGARQRLLAAIHQRDNLAAQEAEHYRRIAQWLAPPDPWMNHESARQRHEPETGAWLLQHKQYLAWKFGSIKLLWVYGKAGCGKTILCSTAIEDMRTHCNDASNIGHAIFYFSFTDNHKQSFQNLVVSLVVQLGTKEPALSMLRQAYEKTQRGQPGLDDLQKILFASLASYETVFLHLDAFDECPETDGVRHNVLRGIEELLQQATNVRILLTSRDVPDVRCVVETLEAERLSIAAHTVNRDIQKYIATQLSRDRKLSRLDYNTRTLIGDTLAQKADGMFRWVFCQLQVLKESKSSKPSSIKAALRALPKDLDETYERMLNNISPEDRSPALTLLRWLAYAETPLSLAELAEASIIDPTDDESAEGTVDVGDRGGWEDTLEILAGLVIVDGGDDEDDMNDGNGEIYYSSDGSKTEPRQRIEKESKVRLGHFSVKEYLESSRILTSEAKEFNLNPAKEHRFLAQSCLVYLMHYSSSSQKTSSEQDLINFPLLQYTAERWFHHALLQECGSTKRELALLTIEIRRRDWLLVRGPDYLPGSFEEQLLHEDIASGLFFASLLGLENAARDILSAGAEVSDQGEWYGSALAAASSQGHKKIVQMLLSAGALVDAKGPLGTALHVASIYGHTDVVEILIDANADPNIGEGYCDTALQAAAEGGGELIVQMLIDAGAHLAPRSDSGYGSALHAASNGGHEGIVRILINAGADIHARPFGRSSALEFAIHYEKVVRVLLDAGAGADEDAYSNALQAASDRDYTEVVQLLLDYKTNVNTQKGESGDAF